MAYFCARRSKPSQLADTTNAFPKLDSRRMMVFMVGAIVFSCFIIERFKNTKTLFEIVTNSIKSVDNPDLTTFSTNTSFKTHLSENLIVHTEMKNKSGEIASPTLLSSASSPPLWTTTTNSSNRNDVRSIPSSRNQLGRQLPTIGRWKHRFGRPGGGYIFFKHIRKAGGTSMRDYLLKVYHYHKGENVTKTATKNYNDTVKINYYEQEFCAMDYNCPILDRRWESTLSVIVLRHPVERHLSEFFYSGPGSQYKELKAMVKAHHAENGSTSSPTSNLTVLLRQEMNEWVQDGKQTNKIDRKFTDNFQTRALSGKTDVLPTEPSPDGIQENCATYHQPKKNEDGRYVLVKPSNNDIHQCIGGPDMPCSYGSGGTYNKEKCYNGGIQSLNNFNVTAQHQQAAMSVLQSFDVVLVTEMMDDSETSYYLADVMGHPSTMMLSGTRLRGGLSSTRSSSTTAIHNKINSGKKKMMMNTNAKTHYYRNFLQATAPDLLELLTYHSRFELGLYEHATKLFKQRLDQWRKEKDSIMESSFISSIPEAR